MVPVPGVGVSKASSPMDLPPISCVINQESSARGAEGLNWMQEKMMDVTNLE